ncbi:N-acetyltransferase [Bifidobacterium sp. W8116]|uniref:N-acetyltransferase n=1 Tax=Bifidobacterium choladohabitans TaxID=2750947 RepID=A0ABS0QZ55_9BIFI|nr:N-acetyltransferase [Bifidobacterium choladohabitans]MBI0143444.1 N-acetyltransferase [Bifidobacterium choladohabitans]
METARWIRHATMDDFEAIMPIYAYARKRMAETGNPRQWGDKYPLPERIREDIAGGHTMLLVDDAAGMDQIPEDPVYPEPELDEHKGSHERIIGVFALFHDPEPDYKVIDGSWLDDRPYTTIHRVAASGLGRHAAGDLLDWSMRRYENIRADTGLKNYAMQHILETHGFTRCGNIIMPENKEIENVRVAYQRHDRPLDLAERERAAKHLVAI